MCSADKNVKSGNLGLGNKDDENEPMELPTLAGTKIKSFAMGRTHVLALTHEGEVYAWGLYLYSSSRRF